ncbi:MAG: bifunctional precorrin-2 dehydrogenase/sirohydrochlorin ferrochelatase [Syntrophales bacterium]
MRKIVKYYPVYLDIKEKRCVVVGGGDVAERKIIRLLECGAVVKVVSRKLTKTLMDMAEKDQFIHLDDNYNQQYLAGAFLVIGATDREEVNDRIAADCRALGVMVNIVDDPGRCDFILPSLVNRGSLSIAVSTDGKSPALARKLREDLAAQFGPEYEDYLDLLGWLRETIIAAGRPAVDNRDIFNALVNSPLQGQINGGRWQEAEQTIRDLTAQEIDLTAFKNKSDKGIS